MPELPEVETVKKVIEPLIVNKTIEEVTIFNKGTIITDLDSFSKQILNHSFVSVERKGKFLLFNLTGNLCILSHLRMEGKYYYFEKEYEHSKHDMISFKLTDNSYLIYNDIRKFGIIGLYSKDKLFNESPLSKIGKEPFEISPEELHKGLENKNHSIKECLLDQSLMCGLGNIYVDETLYATSIHPKTKAKYITLSQCKNLIDNAKRILNEAIAEGGSTIKSFHPAKGIDGRMQNRLQIYGHEGEICKNCGTKFRKIVVGSRGTTFCPCCQKQVSAPFVVGITGPIHSGKSLVSSILEKNGFYKINSDEIVHKLYDEDFVKQKLLSMFGNSIIKDNHLDKNLLLNIIKNPLEKKKLVSFIHPLVAKEAKILISKCKNKNIAFEVPLLVGSGCEDLCDYVVLVLANESIRKNRLLNEGRDAESLLKINQSYRLTETKKISSLIIENNEDIDMLKTKLQIVIDIANKA